MSLPDREGPTPAQGGGRVDPSRGLGPWTRYRYGPSPSLGTVVVGETRSDGWVSGRDSFGLPG